MQNAERGRTGGSSEPENEEFRISNEESGRRREEMQNAECGMQKKVVPEGSEPENEEFRISNEEVGDDERKRRMQNAE